MLPDDTPATAPDARQLARDLLAGAIDVPRQVRDRVQAAEGKRVVLALDATAGARWSVHGTGEAADAEA